VSQVLVCSLEQHHEQQQHQVQQQEQQQQQQQQHQSHHAVVCVSGICQPDIGSDLAGDLDGGMKMQR
jgi:hypothetical protein